MHRRRPKFVLVLVGVPARRAYRRHPDVLLGYGTLLNVVKDRERIRLTLADLPIHEIRAYLHVHIS